MKKLLLPVLAAVALAVPAGAFASGGHPVKIVVKAAKVHVKRVPITAVRFIVVEQAQRMHLFVRHNAIVQNGMIEKLAGTASNLANSSATVSGTAAGAPVANGTFSATVNTDWTKTSFVRNGHSCSPSTGSVQVTDSSDSANTLTANYTGNTCLVAQMPSSQPSTPFVTNVLFGRTNVTSAGGDLSAVKASGHIVIVQFSDGTVKGYTFAGFRGGAAARLRWLAMHELLNI
jgi:hypothetical protein